MDDHDSAQLEAFSQINSAILRHIRGNLYIIVVATYK